MGVIIYGSDVPKISFKQSPNGTISFHIENKNSFYFDKAIKGLMPIPWALSASL